MGSLGVGTVEGCISRRETYLRWSGERAHADTVRLAAIAIAT
jgi:hypothetical protein